MLTAGSIRDQAIVIEGIVVVRFMVTLTCCADHRVWDGRAGLRFLQSVKDVLESGRLAEELRTSRQQVSSLAYDRRTPV
jgi:pyruvate/2-oxoglutarate dehydrogenase complex dihydrolipoamide acyltransferase (E2) component